MPKLKKIADIVLQNFTLTFEAIKNMDKKLAMQVIQNHNKNVKHQSDKIIVNIIKKNKLEVKEAIIIVLVARYLKRISAHLKNIAASIVSPFYKKGIKDLDEEYVKLVG